MIGVSFFVEGLLKDPGSVVVAKSFSIAASSPVRRQFVVLDALSGGDERRVQCFAALRVVKPSSCILDERGNGAARNSLRRFIELFKQEPQTIDLHSGFGVMVLKSAPQAR